MNIEQRIVIIKKLIAAMTLLVSLLQAQSVHLPTQKLGEVKLGVVKPLTDYKFGYIKRDDAGRITEVAVRFYEGAITTENEEVMHGATSSIEPVTRYRRTKRLAKTEIPHITERFIKEQNGADAKIYTDADFGNIYTDEQLRAFLNTKLAGDANRIPIDQEKNL